MPDKTIAYEKRGHIARLTLQSPQTGNAIDLEMARELGDACARIAQNDEVWVVVLAAAGEGVFSSGGNLTDSAPGLGLEPLVPSKLASDAVAALDTPVIAAIDGDALGGGLELALACDLRLASERARFGLPEVSYGLIPGGGGTQRLPRIVGKGKALEMVLTGDPIGAWEAYRVGLVHRVVPTAELSAEVEGLAQHLASKGPIALRYSKEAIAKGLDMTLGQGLRLEADLSFLLQTTEDRSEGIRAFLEKRQADFKGR